jgi:HEPN domain-containing protein
MQPDDSIVPSEWLQIAERDLIRLERALRDADGEQAGFYLQQSVEKFLKAFLLAHGWRLRRTHDLEALIDDAARLDPSFQQYRSVCARVSTYYMLERYPTRASQGLSVDEVRQSWDAVRPLIDHIRGQLP